MKINNKYNLGDLVYLTTDKDQLSYMIVYIVVNYNGLLYGLRYATDEITEHYENEISDKEDIVLKTS